MKWLWLLAPPLLLAGWTWLGQWRLAERYPPLGVFVTVDGLRLHAVAMGEGPPLLLLHGANSNLRDFQLRLMPLLARHYRVIAFDRPGYGHSERPADWPDPARIAQLVLDGAAQLGVEHPLLLGHSWAGSVVMAALVHHPERIAGGVLLAGVAGHWTGSLGWTYTLTRIPVLRELFAWTLLYPVGSRVIEGAVVPVLAPNPVPEDYVEGIAARLALRPQTFLHNGVDMHRLNEYLQRLSPRYDEIRLPLLIIHGEADTLVPFWNHGRRVLPVVPQARAVLLPGVGHAPHHTVPEAVVDALLGFWPPP